MSRKVKSEGSQRALARSPESARDPEPGEKFEGYTIKECIGEGGMGSVYEAVEEFSGSIVAIKFLRGCFTGREDFVLRLQQESKFYSKLKHPNIVRMNRAGITNEGRVFLVMERLRARTLRRILDRARKRQLDFLNALHLMLQIAEAIGAAHEAGVWHRDLKPENVMVGTHDDERGHVWVLDFGIATDGAANTDDLPRLGTYRYLSPEQVRGQKPDGRADIYAFGVMAYEMLAGRHTFLDDAHEATVEEMASGHLYADAPPPVYELSEDCPEPMWPILERCLERDRERRYTSFDEVAEDLRALIRSSVPPEHILAKRVRREKLAAARRSAFDSLHESELEETPPGGVLVGSPRLTEPLFGYIAPENVLPFTQRSPQAPRALRGKGFTEEMPQGPLPAFALAQTAPLGWSPPASAKTDVIAAPPANPTKASTATDVIASAPTKATKASAATDVIASAPTKATKASTATDVIASAPTSAAAPVSAAAPPASATPPAMMTAHARMPARRRAVAPLLVVAPLVGLVLTLAAMVVVLSVRGGRQERMRSAEIAAATVSVTTSASEAQPLPPLLEPAATVQPALTVQPAMTASGSPVTPSVPPKVTKATMKPAKPKPTKMAAPTSSDAVTRELLVLPFDFKETPAPKGKR